MWESAFDLRYGQPWCPYKEKKGATKGFPQTRKRIRVWEYLLLNLKLIILGVRLETCSIWFHLVLSQLCF